MPTGGPAFGSRPVFPATSLELVADAAANDSDKTFTVASDERWHVFAIYVSLVSTGDPGNRQLQVDFRDDSDNVFASVLAGVTQAASLTYLYTFAPGLARETALVSTSLQVPLPSTMLLKPGYDIRVYDVTAVAAAADDMTVRILIDKVKTNSCPV